MILDRVTITGADRSVSSEELIDLSHEFPFVEWGLLVSSSNTRLNSTGVDYVPRFPDQKWLGNLLKADRPPYFKMSCHVCGSWVKDLLLGINNVEKHMPGLLSMFQRIQLNFHGKKHEFNYMGKELLKDDTCFIGKQIILQHDYVNCDTYVDFHNFGLNVVALFDVSHGAGILPEHWPSPLSRYCGYSGGLGPDNLDEQLQKIKDTAWDINHKNEKQGARIWIDMETRVRSDDDKVFDLNKVKKCLEIAKKYIN